MITHPCPRCGVLIPVGVSYCTACRPKAEAQAAEAREHKAAYKQRQYNRSYNKRRDPKYLTFYRSKVWRTLSKSYLQSISYKCEAKLPGCTGIAVEAHHINFIQTEEGWNQRLDWGNLKGVCTACHNKIHERRKKKTDPGVIDMKKIER